MILIIFLNFWRTRNQKATPPKIPANLIHLQDVEFTKSAQRALKMDILHPRRLPAAPMPALVWIHGGAWREGNKQKGLERLIPFARQGFLCASIEYRLSHEAVFPAQIEDCKCAIRFLRAHAQMLHLNPDCIGVWGVSAGGHLAALLGTTQHIRELEGDGGWQKYSSCVQAVCDWFGPTDFLRIDDFPRNVDFAPADAPEAVLIGGAIADNLEKAARANPITYITHDVPPFLIVHADNDLLVPLNQSELLFNALRQAQVNATLEIIRGGGHGNKTQFGSPVLFKKMKNFFKKYLMP